MVHTPSNILHYWSLVNAGVEILPGTAYSQLEELARDLETGRLDINPIESDLSPRDREFSGTQWDSIGSENITFQPFNSAPVPFHTPICPNHGGRPDLLQSFTAGDHNILGNREFSQAGSAMLPLGEFASRSSPLPPSSPLRDSQSQSILSSPVTQTSPISSTAQLSSSPTKPCRSCATQKDPVFSQVRGAAKGSQSWGMLLLTIPDFY
ncbi:hypothetical protein GYMLUDRAFT_64439 [Collybiopsis luxurians FD-317 M1]|uniref:Uncharacterized protein n=1 Tax=Collybiopsis luxurians FD-317 M1 TaxID=944289 RepID=A0A0D0BCH1_9AGAR|nr:hypothetical protein GYMLUDRAFT_64439 [Collybiopsis luxurians FD-317 M1]